MAGGQERENESGADGADGADEAERADGADLARRVGQARLVQRVFDQLPLMVAAVEGPELRFFAVSAQVRAFLGREELIGNMFREEFAEVVGQQIMDIFDRVYVTGRAESLRDFRFQIERPDLGDRVELFSDFTMSPYFGPDGKVAGVITCAEDVTARVRERQAALALAADAQRRYEQVRDVIDALQRELLPAGVPVLPGLEVAATYLLADAETAAGGDWFDVAPLADGRVALVVGDVVGHGVAASATMGQLRVLLHERLMATGDLPGALEAVNAAASWIPGARAATVCAALLDPATGALSYCTAGHPAPMLVEASGQARFLPGTGGGPVGVGHAFTDAVVGTATLAPGATVLLYTDGILERPGRTLAQARAELAQTASDVAADRAFRDRQSPAERMCTQTLELLIRVTGHSDDITLLAGRRVDPPKPLAMTLTVSGEAQLHVLRTGLAEWLADCGVGAADDETVRHALVELATNSLEHAYPDRVDEQATCEITAALQADGRLSAQVRDHGRWREPVPSPDRGLGLKLVAALTDTLRIDHDQDGTTAAIDLRLTRPARLLTAGQLTVGHRATRPDQGDPLLIIDQPWAPAPRIRIDGPVDAATADQVERALRAAGTAGARSLTVDLTGVSHLASAGVAALHRVLAAHRINGTALHLYAPVGSPAEAVMTLIELGHLTRDPHVVSEASPGPSGAPEPPGTSESPEPPEPSEPSELPESPEPSGTPEPPAGASAV